MQPSMVHVPGRDDDVFGEVPLAPSAMTGLSESQLAGAMAGLLSALEAQSQKPDGVPALSDRLQAMIAWSRR
jgi:hypothetical protein